MRTSLFAFLIGCGVGPPTYTSVDAPTQPVADARETHALGMSDVSILLPLPVDLGKPVLLRVNDGAPLVSEGAFVATVFPDVAPRSDDAYAYADFHVVALRFDPCDGFSIGPCTPLSDGRFRLVLQPLYTLNGATSTQDITAHAFFPIPHDDLPAVVQELRALARIQDLDPDAPLQVSPAAMAGNTEYLDRLRALLLRYCSWDRLIRLTTIGQEAESGAFAWIMRGIDRPSVNAAFAGMTIPQVGKTKQVTQLTGGDIIYNIDPVVDSPGGFALAVNGVNFTGSTQLQQQEALSAIVEAQNPTLHDAIDLQCADCHVANYLTTHRSMELGIDPSTLAMSYRTNRNVAVQSIADTDERTIRAFGYESGFVSITRRVANDTAQVLDIIDQRFP